MLLFIYILASSFLGAAVTLIQFLTGPSLLLQLAGNAVFFFCIAGAVSLGKRDVIYSPRHVVLAPLAYIGSVLACGLLGVQLFDYSRAGAVLLMAPWALGYAPSAGPDAPLLTRFPIWVLSNLTLIGLAIAAGASLRARRAEP